MQITLHITVNPQAVHQSVDDRNSRVDGKGYQPNAMING